MRSGRLFWIFAAAFLIGIVGCLEDSAVETPTEIDIVPTPTPPDPDTIVCDPFDDGGGSQDQDLGIEGFLYYRTPDQDPFSSVYDYFEFGHAVTEIKLFFNQLNIPTRPFDRGFVTQGGTEIQTVTGDTLYEWFALHFEGQLQLGPTDMAGDYQFAVLADDGAVLKIDQGSGMNTVIDNDGTHPTRMGCSTEPVYLGEDQKLPFEVDYNQGPRYHIALVVMWRPWPAEPIDVDDPLCGMQGNSLFFDSDQEPPEPQAAYNDLLARGWRPMEPANYALPGGDEEPPNPCNVPAPEISNMTVGSITSSSATVTWDTDIGATTKVIYTHVVSGVEYETDEVADLVTDHTVVLEGLERYALYRVKAVSKSSSGRETISAELSFRTSR